MELEVTPTPSISFSKSSTATEEAAEGDCCSIIRIKLKVETKQDFLILKMSDLLD